MAYVTTRDHDQIQQWAEERGATPSMVSRTGGMLRFEFAPEGEAPELNEVGWTDFFRVFDEMGLELVYDDKPGSRFHKLIYPETAAARASGRCSATPSATPAARTATRMKVEPIRAAKSAPPRTSARAKASSGSKAKTKPPARAKPRARKAA